MGILRRISEENQLTEKHFQVTEWVGRRTVEVTVESWVEEGGSSLASYVLCSIPSFSFFVGSFCFRFRRIVVHLTKLLGVRRYRMQSDSAVQSHSPATQIDIAKEEASSHSGKMRNSVNEYFNVSIFECLDSQHAKPNSIT